MKKEKLWLIIIAILLGVSIIASLFIQTIHQEGKIAEIYQEGKLVKTINLDTVKKAYTFTLEDEHGGHNTILVEPGAISIQEADCPDQICVHQGKISDGIKPIVCLPHELVIKINGENVNDDVDILSK